MEPDDLLCSCNARSRTPLVGHAQWKISQPPSLRDHNRARKEHLQSRSTAAVGVTLSALPMGEKRKVEGTMHAVKDGLARASELLNLCRSCEQENR